MGPDEDWRQRTHQLDQEQPPGVTETARTESCIVVRTATGVATRKILPTGTSSGSSNRNSNKNSRRNNSNSSDSNTTSRWGKGWPSSKQEGAREKKKKLGGRVGEA